MPQFFLDESGRVEAASLVGLPTPMRFADLHGLTKGYIEAMFFTDTIPGVTTEEYQAAADGEREFEGSIPEDCGFSDLAPETLAAIIAKVDEFRESAGYKAFIEALGNEELGDLEQEFADKADGDPDRKVGRNIWYARVGHGVTFEDGDYPEPHGEALQLAAEALGHVDMYLGDDGKIYES